MRLRRMARNMLCALASVSICACGESASVDAAPPGPPPKPVRVVLVGSVPIAPTLEVPGIVEARARMSLAFRVEGFVERFPAEEGARVEAGDVIAELDPRDARRERALALADLERSQARTVEARLEHQRQSELLQSRSTSRQRFEKAKAALEVAEAEARSATLRVEAAEDRIEDCTLKAPVSGYLEQHLIEEHEFTRAGAPVLVLVDLDTVLVRAEAPHRKLALLQQGSAAMIRSSAWPGREFLGKIHFVSVSADPVTHTVPFEVSLENPSLALRPEMLVDVEVRGAVDETLRAVPLSAVLRDAALEPFCFVVAGDENGTLAERRVVTLGRMIKDRATILSGLRSGERVIVRGQHFLSDGDAVRIVE